MVNWVLISQPDFYVGRLYNVAKRGIWYRGKPQNPRDILTSLYFLKDIFFFLETIIIQIDI